MFLFVLYSLSDYGGSFITCSRFEINHRFVFKNAFSFINPAQHAEGYPMCYCVMQEGPDKALLVIYWEWDSTHPSIFLPICIALSSPLLLWNLSDRKQGQGGHPINMLIHAGMTSTHGAESEIHVCHLWGKLCKIKAQGGRGGGGWYEWTVEKELIKLHKN